MRLSAVDLACHRGGRDVFAGVSFSVASGEALAITGRNGAGKSSLLRTIVGLVRIAAGRLALEGGDPELTIAEQAHYLGHQDALKPSLSVGENLRFWAGFLGGEGAEIDGRSKRSGSMRWPTCRPPTFRPASAAGCRLRGSSPSSGRSGCSTSP